MAYVVTGAAGFIGSNLVRALNARGERDIIAVDNLEKSTKFTNLVDCEILGFWDKSEFLDAIEAGEFKSGVKAFFHQGACSDTMESDGRYMMHNNYRYSMRILEHCRENGIPLIYASSAAVYGGSSVFRESREFELPLNVYGYSKFLFDQHVRRVLTENGTQVTGFRYFNVYGPRESHKARMASVAWHFFKQYLDTGKVKPFEGSGGYPDGAQLRDFVSVEDIVRVNLYCLDHPEISGIFNLGTGRAQTFNDVAVCVVNTCRAVRGLPVLTVDELRSQGIIEYVPFPRALLGKYQHFTQADIGSLRRAGYSLPFLSVEQGVERYCQLLLSDADQVSS